MNTSIVREQLERERDVARSWWHLPLHTRLALEDGQSCLLLYNGQPGGSAGPDVRDAVLCFLPRVDQQEIESATLLTVSSSGGADSGMEGGSRLVGDVEFHTFASDWFAHNHQLDPRYNRVILHVTLFLDSSVPTRRQDGALVPTCSLLDLPWLPEETSTWPCQQSPLAADALLTTLLYAGLQRFNARSQVLRESLAQSRSQPGSAFNAYDTCLLPDLAEGLGYGRDRAFFRAAGLRLVGLPTRIPEPLGHTSMPAPLDARRLRILSELSTRWRQIGVWQTLRPACQVDQEARMAIADLRASFHPLSQARADILICNTVLPFAAAVAHLEGRANLANRAYQLYLAYPGLISNRITRIMSTQVQLAKEPGQACLQQGLHYIYSQTCQAKSCQVCLCGGQRL